MFKNLIGSIWRRIPPRVRRLSMRMTHAKFTVTVGGLVFNEQGLVLLLKHRFRPGSGWGLPGGFLEADEQPINALRRELREEIGFEVEEIEVFSSRSFRRTRQVEILFCCRATGEPTPLSLEVERAAWFSPGSLPEGIPQDQRLLIQKATGHGANCDD